MIKTYAKALEFDRRFPHQGLLPKANVQSAPTIVEFHAEEASRMRAAARLARSVIRELNHGK